MKPAVRREEADYIRKTYEVSRSRSCGLIQLNRSTRYYKPEPVKDDGLREALKVLDQVPPKCECGRYVRQPLVLTNQEGPQHSVGGSDHSEDDETAALIN